MELSASHHGPAPAAKPVRAPAAMWRSAPLATSRTTISCDAQSDVLAAYQAADRPSGLTVACHAPGPQSSSVPDPSVATAPTSVRQPGSPLFHSTITSRRSGVSVTLTGPGAG